MPMMAGWNQEMFAMQAKEAVAAMSRRREAV
jgi:hypothetical protein